MADTEKSAWIVRMNTEGGDVVEAGLVAEQLLLGWSNAEGLIESTDYWETRDIVHKTYYSEDPNYSRSGRAASQLWKFIHEFKEGDLVVVPHGSSFYVGEVSGPAFHVSAPEPHDTGHRRPMKWLNQASPISRAHARSALHSRMKSYWTVTSAEDLVDEIEEILRTAAEGKAPDFSTTLRDKLVETTKAQITGGYMDERRFERLVRDLLVAQGAINARIVGRRSDIGADIEADFSLGPYAVVPVRVQVKWWKGEAGAYPIDQLLNAMEGVDLGVVVTSARFTDETREIADEKSRELGKQIVLVDGDELSGAIVDQGLSELFSTLDGD
jgi:predicted Mrr-cat superfamily restriction endonuclease